MSDILVEVDEHGVMLATLNRPERMNALSGELISGLGNAVERASSDDAVKALVVTGAGRAFCAGAEVREDRVPSNRPAPPSRHARLDHFGASGRIAEAIAQCDVPVIGAINGAAAGAGFGLALCCDIRFVGESARMGPIFPKRGLASDYGVSYWLPRIVGVAKTYEIMYDGGLLDASRALELGLANRVFPDDRLLDETLAYARGIAAGAPLATTYIRRLVRRSLDMGQHDALELEWTYQSALLQTKDASEGFRAFLERREPQFEGV